MLARWFTILSCLVLLAPTALAQALLKPNGRDAAPLIEKSLSADVRIDGPVATVTQTLVFSNPEAERIEADFLYTLPESAVATDFAYWYGEEKVIARIAEKERAAEIYKHITTRQRDPALVEMIGKNRFRARIFPVMPNADLKIELRYVLALSREKDGSATFTLPLALPKESPALAECTVTVASSGWEKLQNNLGLIASDGKVVYSGKNFRPNRDLFLRLTQSPSPLAAQLHAAPSGGSDGFFVLTLPQAGRVSISGASTYDVRQKPLGRGTLVTGRYRNSGAATLKQNGVSAPLEFPSAPEPNGPAVKLWASAKLQGLGKSHRKEAVALSLRHGIVCAHTSWLAIPEEERQRYAEEKKEAEIEHLARQVVEGIRRGRERSDARTHFEKLCKELGRNPGEELAGFFQNDLWTLAHRAVRGDRRARREFENLARHIGKFESRGIWKRAEDERWNDLQARKVGRLSELFQNRRENSAEFRRLYREVQTIQAKTRIQMDFVQTTWAAQLRVAAARLDGNPEPKADLELVARVGRATGKPLNFEYARTSVLEDRLAQAIQKLIGSTAPANYAEVDRLAKLLENTKSSRLRDAVRWSADELAQRYLSRLESDPASAKDDRDRLEHLVALGGDDPQKALPDIFRNQWVYQERLYDLARAGYSAHSDPERIRVLEARLARLESAAGLKRGALPKIMSMSDPESEQFRAELLDEKRKPSPDRQRVASLTRALEARSQQHYGVERGKIRVETLLAEAEWDALERAGADPDTVAVAAAKAKELRARFGDPLLQVDAPRDARGVVARFGDGSVKPLAWNEKMGRWELRFDVPPHATPGSWDISVTIVRADGTREERAFPVTVDMDAPEAQAKLTPLPDGRIRLDVTASPDAARATAFFDGGDPLNLTPTGKPGGFFGLLPSSAKGIRVIVTDKAHNRTEIAPRPNNGEPAE